MVGMGAGGHAVRHRAMIGPLGGRDGVPLDCRGLGRCGKGVP